MRISELLVGTVIGASVVALVGIARSANANDRAEDTQTIKTIEHTIQRRRLSTNLMSYCDKDIVLYDFFPPLEYKGFDTARAHEESTFFARAKDTKADFLKLELEADDKLGVARRNPTHFLDARWETERRNLASDGCVSEDQRCVETDSRSHFCSDRPKASQAQMNLCLNKES
jgi:hypothetical protein